MFNLDETIDQLIDSIKSTNNNLTEDPAYQTGLRIYQALVKLGMSKKQAGEVVSVMRIDVIPEVLKHERYNELIEAYAKLVYNIFQKTLADFGEDFRIPAIAERFELSIKY